MSWREVLPLLSADEWRSTPELVERYVELRRGRIARSSALTQVHKSCTVLLRMGRVEKRIEGAIPTAWWRLATDGDGVRWAVVEPEPVREPEPRARRRGRPPTARIRALRDVIAGRPVDVPNAKGVVKRLRELGHMDADGRVTDAGRAWLEEWA